MTSPLHRKRCHSHPPRQTFRFWQPGCGYDSNLFKSKTIRETIDSIHANPVRRGLVEQPTDWKWSSVAAYEGLSPVPLNIDQIDLAEPRTARRAGVPTRLIIRGTLFHQEDEFPKIR